MKQVEQLEESQRMYDSLFVSKLGQDIAETKRMKAKLTKLQSQNESLRKSLREASGDSNAQTRSHKREPKCKTSNEAAESENLGIQVKDVIEKCMELVMKEKEAVESRRRELTSLRQEFQPESL